MVNAGCCPMQEVPSPGAELSKLGSIIGTARPTTDQPEVG